MERITVNGELLMTLKSKEDWIDRFPNSLKVLPKQGINDVWLWVDANGDHCKIGADFEAARQKASYPVKIYKLQRVLALKFLMKLKSFLLLMAL